jgi:hypothetical protein
VALSNFMRPSLRKGAHQALSSTAWQEIRVRSGRDDKFRSNEMSNRSESEVMTPSYADFYDLKRENQSYAAATAFEQAAYNIASNGSVANVGAARVDESFFDTLQSAPELGRAIGADDNQPGHDRVAVISHALWQSMFAGSMDVLTRSLPLNGVSYRIVGVMPPEFEYPHSSDLPMAMSKPRTSGSH